MLTKKKLEILLEKCNAFEKPKVKLEQYVIPSGIVTEILYLAYLKGDIEGKEVYDLGCGTGKFAIGCAMLGAKNVTGVDVDKNAIEIAKANATKLGADVRWVISDVKDIKVKCDTVFQNPPFGVKKKQADRIFLEKALEIANVIYSMHKSSTREFIMKYVDSIGGAVTDLKCFEFALPHTYEFHRKEIKRIKVDIYRIRRN